MHYERRHRSPAFPTIYAGGHSTPSGRPPIYDRVREGRTEILLREIAIPLILHRGPGGGSPPDKMPIYRLPRTAPSGTAAHIAIIIIQIP
jgi:hypothetical protein